MWSELLPKLRNINKLSIKNIKSIRSGLGQFGENDKSIEVYQGSKMV